MTTPAGGYTRFSASRLALLLLSGALLWLLPMGLLTWLYGWDGTLTQMAWFFTKAALLTFGGAYAVLPMFTRGHRPLRLADADADDRWAGTGETTPGPLIMVVAFVAFIGAYCSRYSVAIRALSAALAAALVTWFTFLPSFLFILPAGRW